MNPFWRCYEDICLSNIYTHYILAEIGSSFGDDRRIESERDVKGARLKLDA